MSDPTTFWLVVTNLALGLAVVLLILGVLTGVLCEWIAASRKRHSMMNEMDQDLWRLFHDHHRH